MCRSLVQMAPTAAILSSHFGMAAVVVYQHILGMRAAVVLNNKKSNNNRRLRCQESSPHAEF